MEQADDEQRIQREKDLKDLDRLIKANDDPEKLYNSFKKDGSLSEWREYGANPLSEAFIFMPECQMLESEHGLVDLSQLADKFRRFEEKVYTYCKVIPNPNKRDEIEDLALSILNGVVNRIKDRNITDFNESNFVFEFEDRIMKKMLGIRFLHPDKPARRVKPTQTVPLRTRLLETQHIDALIDILRQMKVLTTEKRCAQFKRYLLGETLKEKIVFSTSIKALCTLFYNLKYARIIKMNKTELTLSIVSALIHHKKGELVFDSVYEYFKPKPSSGSERLTGAHKKYIDFDDHIAKLKPPI